LAIKGFGELAGAVGLLAEFYKDLRQFSCVETEELAERNFSDRDSAAKRN